MYNILKKREVESDMINEPYIKITVTVVIIGYMVYLFWKNVQNFMKCQQARADFIRLHKKDELVFVNQQMLLCTILSFCILTLVIMFLLGDKMTADVQELYWYRVAYISLILIFVGLIFDGLSKRRMILSHDAFQVDEGTFRFRSIVNFEQRGTFFRVVRVLMNDGQKVVVSRKMGMQLSDAYDAWKARKKTKR